MTKIGIDLGKTRSDVCVMRTAEAVTERSNVATTPKALRKFFSDRRRSVIAIEACRDSRWVSKLLTKLGHEVVVVDTSRVRAIGVGQGGRKTDRRDAEALARALWTPGVVPRAHVLSDRAARLRDVLHTRNQLVAQRTALVTMLRGLWQAAGVEAPYCKAEVFESRLREADHGLVQTTHVQVSLAVLKTIGEQLQVIDAELALLAEAEEPYERLTSVPGVKLIVATSFIAAIDDPLRFQNAHQVQAYLGLVPRESSTGGKRRVGAITKAGNPLTRAMLIQAAQTLIRVRGDSDDPLVLWARQVAARRGRKVAVVAAARRLVGILWAMWVDGSFYDPRGLRKLSADGLSRKARLASHEARAMTA